MNYLRDIENFLDMKIETRFSLEKIKKIEQDLSLPELAKMMFGMMHPYVMYNEQVYTPWDVCLKLLSKDIEIETKYE